MKLKEILFFIFLGINVVVFGQNSPDFVATERGNEIVIFEDTPLVENIKAVKETSTNLQKIISTAYSYLGTPHRSRGISRSGIDCSALIHAAYSAGDINLGRSSQDMANQAKYVPLSQVKVGDLLFFHTVSRTRITHVGMVVEVGDSIKFIHTSTSKGVTVSSLDELYWSESFAKAGRIL